MNSCLRAVLAAGLALTALTAAAQQPPAKAPANANLPTEATVNSFLQHMFGWNQSVTWKIADIKPSEAAGVAEITVIFNTPDGQAAQRIYVTSDQKNAFSGDLVPFGADPFAAARNTLKAADGPVHGPADAVVTIVEFGDLECPACKKAQENLNKLMSEEPKAKLIFQNFPLESLHKWAMLGAKYVDCLARQNNDTVFKFIATVYDHQGEITDQTAEQSLKNYVKEVGADPDAISACVAKPETEQQVRASIALGEKLSVTATPTFFINGRKVQSFINTPYEVIKSMVDYDLAHPVQ